MPYAETTSDMQFWYYKDGSVDGDTVEVEQKNNVEIDGTEYEAAFEFPIKSDNEFVGVVRASGSKRSSCKRKTNSGRG